MLPLTYPDNPYFISVRKRIDHWLNWLVHEMIFSTVRGGWFYYVTKCLLFPEDFILIKATDFVDHLISCRTQTVSWVFPWNTWLHLFDEWITILNDQFLIYLHFAICEFLDGYTMEVLDACIILPTIDQWQLQTILWSSQNLHLSMWVFFIWNISLNFIKRQNVIFCLFLMVWRTYITHYDMSLIR